MFCPNQLLVYPRKAQLTIVWHAATLSETQFKNRNKSGTINKINIAKICEEIQEIACNKNESGIKFSLYLLSQLMHGVTKLHLHQVAYYEKNVFEFHKNLSTKEKKEFDAITNFDSDPFNMSLRTKINPQLDENLHLSQYQNLDNRLQIMMTATVGQDFGALTDTEMDFMCESDIILMEERLRIAHYNKRGDNTKMIEDIEITEEIHQERSLSQTSLGPMLVNVSEVNAKLSMTPQKRETQAQSQVDTPTKKRRLSFEEMVAPSTEAVTEKIRVPMSQQVAPISQQVMSISQQVAPIAQQIELYMVLQSLESFESFSIVKKSKNIIDENIILNDKLCVKWRRNVNIWCKKMEIVSHLTSAETLLTQSSHKRCADRLRPLFNNHFTFNRIIGPSSTSASIVPTEPIQLAEPRAEELTRVNLPIELSGLGKTNMMMADGSTVVHEASAMPSEMIVPDIGAEGATENITKGNYQRKDISINETQETLEDITILLERQHLKNDFVAESPVCSSRTSQNILLTNQDILAMLETFLYEKEYITFNDLISDTYSTKDKIQAFNLLLELHAQQKVALAQEDCHSTLYIYKYI